MGSKMAPAFLFTKFLPFGAIFFSVLLFWPAVAELCWLQFLPPFYIVFLLLILFFLSLPEAKKGFATDPTPA